METISIGGRNAAAPWLMLIVTAIFLTSGLMLQEHNWLIASIIPFVLAIGLLPLRSPLQTIEFTPTGLSVNGDPNLIEYRSIQGITIGNRCPDPEQIHKFPSGTCQIALTEGVLQFDGLTSAQAQQLMDLLIEHVPRCGSAEVGSSLQKRLKNDIATFDPDLISTFCAREKLWPNPSRELRIVLTLIVIGVLLIIAGAASSEEGWIVAGVICGLASFIVFLISKARRGGIKDWEFASMVISPRGIALEQGPLVGQIRWEEIRKLECGATSARYNRTIRVVIDGSEILIHDIYDRPLSVIFDIMDSFYRD